MKALVTGSTGFIGSHLVEALLKRGYEAHGFIRPSSDLRWIKDLDLELRPGSYENEDSLRRAVEGMDVVFHVGAVISASDWETYERSNVRATIRLLEACADACPALKKFVFVSSISASGPARHKRPLRESDPCFPVSLYGKSKLLAEEAAARFFDKLPIVILRPTNVLGVRQKQLTGTIRMARKRIVPQLGNGDRQTTICFVQDVVRALILAADSEAARGKTYFVADPKPYSWREILDAVTGELGLSFVVRIPHPVLLLIARLSQAAARRTGGRPLITRKAILSVRNNYWLQDVRLIKEELGFSPEISLKDGIRDIIAWYKRR